MVDPASLEKPSNTTKNHYLCLFVDLEVNASSSICWLVILKFMKRFTCLKICIYPQYSCVRRTIYCTLPRPYFSHSRIETAFCLGTGICSNLNSEFCVPAYWPRNLFLTDKYIQLILVGLNNTIEPPSMTSSLKCPMSSNVTSLYCPEDLNWTWSAPTNLIERPQENIRFIFIKLMILFSTIPAQFMTFYKVFNIMEWEERPTTPRHLISCQFCMYKMICW